MLFFNPKTQVKQQSMKIDESLKRHSEDLSYKSKKSKQKSNFESSNIAAAISKFQSTMLNPNDFISHEEFYQHNDQQFLDF